MFFAIRETINGDTKGLPEKRVLEKIKQSEYKKSTEAEAISYAENFLNDYLNYKEGNDQEYMNKLNKYNDFLNFEARGKESQVLFVNANKVKWQNKNLILVDCRVKIEVDEEKHKPPGTKKTDKPKKTKKPKETKKPEPENTPKIILKTKPTPTKEKKIKILNMQVAISTQKNNLKIINYPLIIGSRKKDNSEPRELPGKDVEKNEELIKSVKAFIKAYYSGDSTSLEYYLADGIKLNSLENNNYEIDINDENIQVREESNKYNVKLTYKLNGHIDIKQGMELILIKQGSKYFVKSVESGLF